MEILLVIDVQEKYMGFYREGLLDAVNARIYEAKKLNVPIVYIRNIGVLGNSSGYDFTRGLNVESELVFDKRFPDAFTNKEFAQKLKEMDVDTIDVVGVDGRCCVFRTVMTAIEQGLGVKLYLDAVGARQSKFYEKELQEMKAAGAECVECHF